MTDCLSGFLFLDAPGGGRLTRIQTANVDEVFIDICRQMLRADDAMDAMNELDDNGRYRSEERGGRRRKRRRNKDHPRCVLL